MKVLPGGMDARFCAIDGGIALPRHRGAHHLPGARSTVTAIHVTRKAAEAEHAAAFDVNLEPAPARRPTAKSPAALRPAPLSLDAILGDDDDGGPPPAASPRPSAADRVRGSCVSIGGGVHELGFTPRRAGAACFI